MRRFADALAWLEQRVEAETRRLRARYELSLDELRGLFISDAMVDALLAERGAPSAPAPPPAALGELAGHLGLGDRDAGALLILLAPEIDPRFWTLFAYLNDDAARRWPTPDLVGRLLGEPADALFAPASPIVRNAFWTLVPKCGGRRPPGRRLDRLFQAPAGIAPRLDPAAARSGEGRRFSRAHMRAALT